MIFATALYEGKEQVFSVDGAGCRVFPLARFFEEELDQEQGPASMQDLIANYDPDWTDRIAFFFGSRPELALTLHDVRLIAPIPSPRRNVVCLGKNYAEHARELVGQLFSETLPTHPIYFTKPEHCVTGQDSPVLLHAGVTRRLDYEAELAVVIGKEGINIPKENAEEYIFGYTIGNDVSARDLQKFHSQWFKGKSLSTHCPIGPWIVHKSQLPLPLELPIRSYVNNVLRQEANTRDMIFDIPTIISDLSKGYPLKPGDIILTGTPAGVGMAMDPPQYLKDGDVMLCEIEKIGFLVNTITG